MPPSHVVPVDIKTVQLDGGTKLFQCHCSAYLRFEAEYGRKRGTTSNAYLLLDGTEGILIDVPRKEYLDVFCALSAPTLPCLSSAQRNGGLLAPHPSCGG